MRTTIKARKELMKEARKFLEVNTDIEVWEHIGKARSYYERKLGNAGFSMIQISCCKDNCWSISGLIPDAPQFFFQPLSLEELCDSPFKTVKSIIEKHENKL